MKKYITIEKYLKDYKDIKIHKSKTIWYILLIIFLFSFIFSLYTLLKWNLDNYKIYKLNKKIDNIKTDSFNYNVDFIKLLNQNKDTIGFIEIKNTIIKYPVVQTSDNNYYLNHSFDNKKNNAGWIFMDYRNHINELDDNTVIYGHSRLDGSLFGILRNLLKVSNQDLKDKYLIYFINLNEKTIFQIFSIYTIKSENYYITTTFNNNYEKQKWIDTIKERNLFPNDTDININDKFLTLSTCQNTKGERIVIHAKLIKKEKM